MARALRIRRGWTGDLTPYRADLSRYYWVPDPNESYEEWLRSEHLDLPELDDLALWQELKRVEDALAYSSERSSSRRGWLIERLAMVRRERNRREF